MIHVVWHNYSIHNSRVKPHKHQLMSRQQSEYYFCVPLCSYLIYLNVRFIRFSCSITDEWFKNFDRPLMYTEVVRMQMLHFVCEFFFVKKFLFGKRNTGIKFFSLAILIQSNAICSMSCDQCCQLCERMVFSIHSHAVRHVE